MKTHWDSLCGCEFFTVEVLGITGTSSPLRSRPTPWKIAGIASNPVGEWMLQMARNLTDSVDGFLRNAAYLVHDR